MTTTNALRIGRYLTCNGPMARSVNDLILMLDVLSNTVQSISENPPVNLKQYAYETASKIKIAYSKTLDNVQLDNEYQSLYLLISLFLKICFIISKAKIVNPIAIRIKLTGNIVIHTLYIA